MKKLICIVLIVIISVLQLSIVFADTVNTLQFGDIESQIVSHNTDVKINESLRDNSDIDNSITNLQNLKSAMDIAASDLYEKSTSVYSSPLDGTTQNYLSDVYSRMSTMYSAMAEQIAGQISGLKTQLSNNVYSPVKTITRNSIVWNAQQLYFMYISLGLQKEDLNNKFEQLKIEKNIASLKKEIGMISGMDLEDLSTQIEDINTSIKVLDNNMNNIIGQLNLMLGQDFNISLTLGEIPLIDDNAILSINYDKDYETAKEKSLSLKSLGSVDKYIMDKEIRNLKFTFDKKYKDVFNKQSVLDNETVKLGREDKKLSTAKLKFEAGLISHTDYENQSYSLKTQAIKVKTAQLELFKSLTAYQWLLRGYDASIN